MDFKKLPAYQKAFQLAMEIFKISKSLLKEEKYSLTDQIRRSSRSTCANLAEAYRKRIYSNHFIAKLTDSDGENSETDVWLDFAK
ncbi:four helix bundle protein [Sunxiuqinia indica]|uniref:four helix bundle protein n=1 Tax=Sunxiuqinia indica TaxID=2692584 RepID=UPI0019160F82|nr:four helix bundle protein [Sunxiuqinia indica]